MLSDRADAPHGASSRVYSSVREVALSLSPRSLRKWYVVTAYVDDGGDEGATVMGCYVATAERWSLLCNEWVPFTKRFGIEVSHGKRLIDALGALDAKDQASYFTGARNIIDRHCAFGVIVCFQNADYERYYRACDEGCPARTRHHSAFGLAFSKMMASVGPLVMLGTVLGTLQLGKSDKLNYVVDCGNPNGGAARDLFYRRKSANSSNASEYARLLGTLSYDTDEASPELQAADLLAWCFNRLYHGESDKTPQAFFSSDIRPPNIVEIRAEEMIGHKADVVSYVRRTTSR